MKKLLIALCIGFTLGCQSSAPVDDLPPATAEQSQSDSGTQAQATTGSGLDVKVRIAGFTAEEALKVSPGGDLDLSNGEWTTEHVDGDINVLKGGQFYAKVVLKEMGKWVVEDSSGKRIAKIKTKDDGSYKVVDGNEKFIAKLKPKDTGFKVKGEGERVILKAKVKDGRVKVKDGDGKEMAKVKNTTNALLITWLSIPDLPIEVRVGMAAATWSDIDG